MAAAAVTVNRYNEDLANPAYKEERVNVTLAATGDWYTCRNIATIQGFAIGPNYAMAAADSIGATYATNVLTFAAVAGGATGVFDVIIWGV